jgi:hypothetical protein
LTAKLAAWIGIFGSGREAIDGVHGQGAFLIAG